jgi:type II secretory pathway pseudopilin PulG
VTHRARSACAVLSIAVTLGCSGCVPTISASSPNRATGNAVAPDATSRQISELQQSKRVLEAQIDALKSATPSPSASSPVTSSSADEPVSAWSGPSATPSADDSNAGTASVPDLATKFAALERRLGGANGISVVPVGPNGQVRGWGSLTSAVAWSTIKVPLGVAAVRADGGHPSTITESLLRRAITQSDNAAAESLWARLGSSATAASAVAAVLRDAGDSQTRVQARRVRAGYTPFGQTVWPLARQAQVAGHLPCLHATGPVLTAMGQVVPSQRWGLGRMAGARYKGGWGPDTDGRYLARQFGILALPQGGQIAVAIATRPADGSFTTATAHLDAIASWLQTQLPTFTGGHC